MTKTNIIQIVSKRAQVDTASRTARFVLSSDRSDRTADRINQAGWDLSNYLANPVILWGHDHDIPAIGNMVNLGIEGRELVGDIKFAPADAHPFADTVFKLVSGDVIRAGSVGFIPLEWSYDEERGGFNFERQELLEYSICNVPMNPDALRRAAKSAHVDDDEFEALLRAPTKSLPDSRTQLIEQSKAAKVARSLGRLRLRAAVSTSYLKVRKSHEFDQSPTD